MPQEKIQRLAILRCAAVAWISMALPSHVMRTAPSTRINHILAAIRHGTLHTSKFPIRRPSGGRVTVPLPTTMVRPAHPSNASRVRMSIAVAPIHRTCFESGSHSLNLAVRVSVRAGLVLTHRSARSIVTQTAIQPKAIPSLLPAVPRATCGFQF